MKQTAAGQNNTEAALDALCEVLLAVEGVDAMRAFLLDLCTPAELEALIDRWQVVPHLSAGKPYRQIHAETGVSATTIGRGARIRKEGHGGQRHARTQTRQPTTTNARKRDRQAKND